MATPTVLVMDGDQVAREELVRRLVRRGFQVWSCGALAEARDRLRTERFACAVIDVVLADGDGLEALVELRRLVPRLPIIVTAARNTRQQEARVRQHDVLFYHVKEFDQGELLEAVREALGCARRTAMEKILVIDDDPDYQAAVRDILESGGYHVVPAFSKDEGMQKLASEHPDLIILDIMMDHATDGFHFLYEMQAQPGAKRVPVISVTSVSARTGFDFVPSTDGDYFPADDYMAKPVRAEELLSRVRALLARGK